MASVAATDETKHSQDSEIEDFGTPAFGDRLASRKAKTSRESPRKPEDSIGFGKHRGALRNKTPSQDSSSSLRPSQHFRVGNLGNNGLLYLKPIRHTPHSPTSPPITPTANTTNEIIEFDDVSDNWRESVFSDNGTVFAPSKNNSIIGPQTLQPSGTPSKPSSRSQSDILITNDQPQELCENTKLKDGSTGKALASAFGSETGDAFHRLTKTSTRLSSRASYTQTEDFNSLNQSMHSAAVGATSSNTDFVFPNPPTADIHELVNSTSPNSLYPKQPAKSERRHMSEAHVSSVSTGSQPQSNAQKIRVSPTTGQILAATPTGLIAQITSNLSNDMVTDFFLTYRSYLTSNDLAQILFSRLKWAINRTDQFGRVVSVRTFNALRHWILNYFLDDFVPDVPLRELFCSLLNNLSRDLRSRDEAPRGALHILEQLKRCWRRTSLCYWDEPQDSEDTQEELVRPGGHLGSRKARCSKEDERIQFPTHNTYISSSGRRAPWSNQTEQMMSNLLTETPNAPSIAIGVSFDGIPRLPRTTSEQSAFVASCSIPYAPFAKPQLRSPSNLDISLTGPSNKVDQDILQTSSAQKDYPKHRRSGSFSDSVRDNRPLHLLSPTFTGNSRAIQPPAILLVGSIVRGISVGPASAQVDSLAPKTPETEDTAFFLDSDDLPGQSVHNKYPPSSFNVRRLVGGMRRALTIKTPNDSSRSPTNDAHSFRRYSAESGPRPSMASSRKLEPGPPKRKLCAGRAYARVDILSGVARRSYLERFEMYHLSQEAPTHDNWPPPIHGQVSRESRSPQDITLAAPGSQRMNSCVTLGSGSIPIVDDTNINKHVQSARPSSNHTDARSNRSNHISSNSRDIPVTLDSKTVPPLPTHFLYARPNSTPLVDTTILAKAKEHRSPSKQEQRSDIAQTSYAQEDQGYIDRLASPDQGEANITATHDKNNDDHTKTQPRLRRRPGGDLRAAEHIQSLAGEPSNRRTDTVSTISSPTNITSRQTQVLDDTDLTSLNGVTLARVERKVSECESDSSSDSPRASFEQAVAKLAELPDDEDDGGVECALRKLEGRFPIRNVTRKDRRALSNSDEPRSPRERRHNHVIDTRLEGVESPSTPELVSASATTESSSQMKSSPENMDGRWPASNTVSETSYSPTPIVEQKWTTFQNGKPNQLVEDGSPARKFQNTSVRSFARDDRHLEPHAASRGEEQPKAEGFLTNPSHDRSYRDHNAHSFLLDDNESLTDESDTQTEVLLELNTPTFGAESSSKTKHLTKEDQGLSIDDKKLSSLDKFQKRPSYDPSRVNGLQIERRSESQASLSHEYAQTSTTQPTLQSSVKHIPLQALVSAHERRAAAAKSVPPKSRSALELRELSNLQSLRAVSTKGAISDGESPAAAHLPFILGYGSHIIAQQMTLIEIDALAEIDWRELIDVRWKQSSRPVNNWMNYLESSNDSTTNHQQITSKARTGIDICIARFNLVVSWTASEIVMTQDLHERVACIVKYIHIAQRCRSMRNWATMYQIATALTKADIARLKKTWKLVPTEDKQTLKTLETLIMPTRNFHSLRAEMETVACDKSATNGGCVPFIGIYTHDLLYNAQKPLLATKPHDIILGEDEPWVNFERHQTAAVIVRNLLRLLEECPKYNIQPDPDALSRCIWISALSDEEVTRKSLELEP